VVEEKVEAHMVAAKVEEVRIPLQGEAHMLQKAEKARAERAPVEVARVARPEAAQKVHPTSPSRANANEQTGGSDTTTPRGSNGFYDGGASTAYRAGAISPLGVRPFFIRPFVFWWPLYYGPYGAYYYQLNDTVPAAANNTAHNKTDPVLCVCEVYDQCGCDNSNSSFTPTDYTYAVVNGTEYAVINGTLSNGTSATSAAGPSMGLYLTKSGTWTSWLLFGVITLAFVQAL
jgi:hypothetical protein